MYANMLLTAMKKNVMILYSIADGNFILQNVNVISHCQHVCLISVNMFTVFPECDSNTIII